MRLPGHVGHLGEVAGHDHWIAGIGAGVVVAGALVAWWAGRGRGAAPETEAAEDGDDAPEGERA